MIDFKTVKKMTIPEGSVAKITDASGNVLWSGVEKVTITINVEPSTRGSGFATATINGVTYGDSTGTYTVDIPVGTVITCYAAYGKVDGDADGGAIYLNSTQVAYSSEGATYDYTVTGNATIRLYNGHVVSEYITKTYKDYGFVYITED